MASLHNSLRSASPAPSRGLSPLPFSDASTLLAGTHPPLAPASAVFSLESHMNLHIGKIEDQLSQLLGGVKQISMTVQALAPTQPLPNPTPLSSGESATSPSACFFPWVLQDIISTIALDNLKPEHLVTLRNPESLPRLPEKQPTGFLTPTLAAQTQPHKHLQEVSLMVTSSTTQGDVVCHQALPPVVHKASTAPNSAFHFTANSPNTTAITTPNSASRPFPLNHTSHHATPDSTPMASTTPNSALVPTSLHLPFDFVPQGIIDIMSSSAATLLAFLLTGTPPPCRPNTTCHLPIFDALNAPATISSLNLTLWLSVPNLHMDQDNELHLCQEIEARLLEGRLRPVQDPACLNLICSPVGIVPKPHSSKCWTIYHLSHPHRPGSHFPSINASILPSFVSIRYKNLDVIINFICQNLGTHLWKANLEDTFCHIIVADSDARLMGIHFDSSYYQECTLAFGGCSSPFLFNLFAEFLHWLTSFTLNSVSPAPHTHLGVSHYLDDFDGASEPGTHPAVPIQILSLVTAALGFRLSRHKTVWDTTCLEILSIELNSVAQTASITDNCCQQILQLCLCILEHRCVSLLELQQVAGHLQFITQVVPHGCAFLCCLYDVNKAPFSRRLNKGACNELSWWRSTLAAWDSVSLLQPSPLVIEHLWTDTPKWCVGGHWGTMMSPKGVFSRELSH
ncbi:uncharacterized protein UBRO_20187 [Ustilago bromivora]|uniref:Reverse transcriptase domain-containing protein n=1 Tax=Ustilago bromivora TaxID=307758 RepID=A0A1K0GCB6_9BASI|nr:uncharacterized protein UBRO_20187 [Ustilago bromivora]